jgi:hypothetical protein
MSSVRSQVGIQSSCALSFDVVESSLESWNNSKDKKVGGWGAMNHDLLDKTTIVYMFEI